MFIPFEEAFPGKGKEVADILEGRVLLFSYVSVFLFRFSYCTLSTNSFCNITGYHYNIVFIIGFK